MEKTLTMLTENFESSSGLTRQFQAFSRTFKREFTKLLASLGATGVKISRGHFDLSGFFQIGERIWYFSIGDVRGNKSNMLVRTATSFTDYTGGRNNFVLMDDEFIDGLKRLIK